MLKIFSWRLHISIRSLKCVELTLWVMTIVVNEYCGEMSWLRLVSQRSQLSEPEGVPCARVPHPRAMTNTKVYLQVQRNPDLSFAGALLVSEVLPFARRLACDVLRLTHSCRVVNNLSRAAMALGVICGLLLLRLIYDAHEPSSTCAHRRRLKKTRRQSLVTCLVGLSTCPVRYDCATFD